MAKPHNHDMSGLRPFKEGQSGNPGGITKEQKRVIMENAERALRIRQQMLVALENTMLIAAETDWDDEEAVKEALASVRDAITPENLRLMIDSENRHFGTPTQRVEGEVETTIVRKTIYEGKPDD